MKKQKIHLKSPFGYYGGKQRLAQRIISLIPKHTTYIEPFFGGGAIYFGKEPSSVEIINDTNHELINFYRVLKQDCIYLMKELNISLHSRLLHKHANAIMENPELFSPIKRAWAVFISATQGFASMLGSSWGYDVKVNTMSKKVKNKIASLTEDYTIRLQNTQIECTDAIRIINSRNHEDSFIYCDPPYFNSDCGHYDGYSKQDFENLLIALRDSKGKFLLSSYPSPILSEYTKANGWHTIEIEMNVAVSKKGKRKVEVLTSNYPIKLDS